jgi:undecaprenyl-phosphate 4-deoxy-4-formamido-L-arabinose transferase
MNKASVSVLVPVFNSEGSLPLLVERLKSVLEPRLQPFEILLVNDGSRDRSWEVVSALAKRYDFVRGINLMRNYGQHNGLLCAIRSARYEIAVTLDDDLQNPPEEIPKLLAKLGEGFDVVYGTPNHQQHGFLRNAASAITKLTLQTVMGADAARNVSAFRAFRTDLRDAFARYHGPFVSIDVLLTWGTSRFAAVPVAHESRETGASNYTFRMLVAHAFNMMTGFSILPLQLASLMGFLLFLLGVGVFLYVLLVYFLRGSPVPGFPFLASIISIFSGAQLLSLGIIGEYLARMHFRMMDRPAYAVRMRTEEADPRDG